VPRRAASREERWLAVALGLAGAAYDPSATAATAKTAVLVVVSLGALALALPAAIRGDRSLSGRAALCFVLLGGWSLASLAWADHPRPDAPLVVGAALALVASGMAPAALRRCAGRAAAITAVIGAGAVIGAWLRGARGLELHGWQGNPDWLGLVLAAALPLVVGRVVDLRGERALFARLELGALLVVLVLALGGVVLSSSRTAWIALAGAAIVTMPGRWRVVGIGGAAVVAIVLWRGGLGEGASGRLWIARVTLDAGARALPFGHGAGDFPFVYLEAQAERLATMSLDEASARWLHAVTAHDDWLELFATGGLPAILFAAGALGLAFLDLQRSWRAGAACIVVVAIAMAGDAALHQPALVALLGLLLGASRRLDPRRGDAALATAIFVALVALLPRAALDWITERRLTRAAALEPSARLVLVTETARAAPHSGEAALALGLARAESGDPAAALPELERARAALPDTAPHLAAGNAYLALGHVNEAIAAFRRALAIHPASFRAHLDLAEAYRRAGDLDAAERHLASARELQPHHPKLEVLAEDLRRARIEAVTR
jgi:tetratricopeptide (TPR) repeat protein